MNHDTPLSPRPLRHLSEAQRRVLTLAQLRQHGVSPAAAADRSVPGGPWQQILPGVYLLHPGPPTSQERLHAALLYAGRPVPARAPDGPDGRVAPQPGAERPRPAGPFGEAVITGLAALALHGFTSAPSLLSLDRIDVLVPRSRRLRSTGPVHIVRSQALPGPLEITGVPVAPVPRALADAVARLTDASVVRRLLTEALRGGHCDVGPVVRELTRARLLSRPQVLDALDTLHAEGRALAEGRLHAMVRDFGLPVPLFHVALRQRDGAELGGVDAYWPEQAVAVEIDTRPSGRAGAGAEPSDRRGHLERLGVTVVHTTPKLLRDRPDQQAAVVRTALMAAEDRAPAAYLEVLPR